MEKHLGVYIHIPFCASKCAYCDFYSLSGCDNLMPKYQHALIEHIKQSAPSISSYYVDTVYFGGGTPSYYGARRICEIFDALKRAGRVLKSAEATIEANPDSITRRDMKLLLSAGINRLSIGAQSANDDILKMIGRRHNWKQVEKAVANAREAGFKNISLDLMFGLPSQKKTDWADTLAAAIALRPDHVSCYGLKIEEGTPLWSYKDSPFLADDDEQADMYLYAVETLERYGYYQYEVSNFSLRDMPCRHNLKYWRLDDYIGFGPGAHSCLGNTRYSYIKNLKGYISGVSGDKNIIDEHEQLDNLSRASEYIMLGMRTRQGISGKKYQDVYRCSFEPVEDLLKTFEKHGWAKYSAGSWSFTPAGFLVSNTLIGALVGAQAERKLEGNPWMQEAMEKLESVQIPKREEPMAFYEIT